MTPLPVVLSTDCGAEMDDQWALAHLLLSQEIDLIAVIGAHASSVGMTAATAAHKAMEVIEHIGPLRGVRPQVVAGSDLPLVNETAPHLNVGVETLLELTRGFGPDRRLTVFVIAAERIAVVAMGFDDWPGGGDVFNVRNDPAAYRIILGSDVPLTVGSAALCLRALRLTRGKAADLIRPHGAAGEYLFSLLADWLDRQAALAASVAGPDAWVIWDEVVTAWALGLTRGDEVARPTLLEDLSFAHPPTQRRITWLTHIDGNGLWADLAGKIDLWQGAA